VQFAAETLPDGDDAEAWQATHAVEAVRFWYVPAGQAVHALPMLVLYLPATHATHGPPSGPAYAALQRGSRQPAAGSVRFSPMTAT